MKKIFAIILVILLVVAPVNKARATALVPIITDAALTQIENAAIGQYIYYLLSSGIDLSFEGFVNGSIDTFKDMLNLGTTNSTISDFVDDFIDEYTGETERIISPVKNDKRLVRKIKDEFVNNSPDSVVSQPIDLDDIQIELLKGAYNLWSQNITSVDVYNYSGKVGDLKKLYDEASKLIVAGQYVYGSYSRLICSIDDNVNIFINSSDYSISLYTGNFETNISDTVLSENNFYTVYNGSNKGYYRLQNGLVNRDSPISQFILNDFTNWAFFQEPLKFSYAMDFYYGTNLESYPNYLYAERNLNNALASLWGCKNIPIYIGTSISNAQLLKNPTVSHYSFDGGFIANTNYKVPMVIEYPEGSRVDYTSIFESLISAINSKSTLSFSDIEDLIVDVNGQKAVASYVVATYDLDKELGEQYSVLVDYQDNTYTMAFAENIENGGVIISQSTDIIPDELWIVLVGSAIFSLICLLWARMLK